MTIAPYDESKPKDLVTVLREEAAAIARTKLFEELAEQWCLDDVAEEARREALRAINEPEAKNIFEDLHYKSAAGHNMQLEESERSSDQRDERTAFGRYAAAAPRKLLVDPTFDQLRAYRDPKRTAFRDVYI